MYSHGVTSARGRSVRAEEVYKNTWIAPGPPSAQHPMWSINGGTTLFWGNTINQFATMVQLDYVRRNNNVYSYGSVPSGWGNCVIGSSYQVWDSAANSSCMDMAGRGQGDLLKGYPISGTVNSATGTMSYPRQALSPLYIWGNTLVNVATPINNSGGYVQNRDYFTDSGGSTGVRSGALAARPSTCTTNSLAIPAGNSPGQAYWATDENTLYVCTATNTWTRYYTLYTYPHPLAGGTQQNPPAAPTNLTITVQ